jgi:LytS/YehU family sensor histidine kinase
MAQAHLQVLQAQIEPHFLFNTLANVRRLYEADRDAGHAMLDNLMHYFKVALPQMRGDTSTVEREAALAEAYLNVQQIRFGRRLGFDIDIPPAVKALEVPPMMLMTLVENAVKHGIAPLPQGGTIGVAAEVADGRLVLSVRDTGRGLSETAGAGMGLANIRARLTAAYGNSAGLSITGNQPRGIVATLSLPIVDAAFA